MTNYSPRFASVSADQISGLTTPLSQGQGGTGASSFGAATFLATGSATARSLADRFREAVNVKDEGATGDGATDDTAAIASAHTKAAAAGIPLYFPPGTYLVTGLTNITQPIFGLSRFTTTIKAKGTNTTHLLKLADSVSGWSMQEITLDGASVGGHAFASTLAINLEVRQCRVLNAGLSGLYITNGTNIVIEDNYVTNAGSAPGAAAALSGAGVNLNAKNGTVRRNTITNCGGANITLSSYVPAGSVDGWVDVEDNYCSGAGTVVTQDNITGYDSTNVRIRVRNNRCDNSANHNIHVGGADCEISGNFCTNATFNNIFCSSRLAGTSTIVPFNGAKILGNTCDTAGSGYYNIYSDQVSQASITKNICRNSGGTGISAVNGTGVEINDNTVVNAATHGISIAGLITSTVSDNRIDLTGNTSGHCLVNNIYNSTSSSNTLISDNVVKGGVQAWFGNDSLASVTVRDNISAGTLGNTNPFQYQGSDTACGNLGGGSATAFIWGRRVIGAGNWGSAIGLGVDTKLRTGFHGRAAGFFSVAGDAQCGFATLLGQTGAGTTCNLTADGSAAGSRNLVNIGTGVTMAYTGIVVAHDASLNSKAWEIQVLVKNVGGTITIVSSAITAFGTADSAASTWSLAVAVDNTNLAAKWTLTAAAGVKASANLTCAEII
jgi:hypothetical protein